MLYSLLFTMKKYIILSLTDGKVYEQKDLPKLCGHALQVLALK